MNVSDVETRKARAKAWFEQLRVEICAAFEKLEDEAPAALYPGAPARFVRTPWQRTDRRARRLASRRAALAVTAREASQT